MIDAAHRERGERQVLEAADRVARAAYLWVRRIDDSLPSPGSPASDDLAAGILCGLCRALHLDERHALMSAYIFALIDGDAAEAMTNARAMLGISRCRELDQKAFRAGLRAAGELVNLMQPPRGTDGRQPLPA